MVRKALISIFVIVALYCFGILYRACTPAHIDLREPIYLVINKNFFSGCEHEELEKEMNCKQSRIDALNDGADDWFKHFDEATRPRVVIVYSNDEVPFNPTNSPIYIKLEKDFCDFTYLGTKSIACYKDMPFESPMIVFDSSEDITSTVFAHELGHAFGRSGGRHDDTPDTTYSTMSYSHTSNYVVPVDIKLLCIEHPECPPHDDTWCEASFWDSDRCPSSSYEDSEKKLQIDWSSILE